MHVEEIFKTIVFKKGKRNGYREVGIFNTHLQGRRTLGASVLLVFGFVSFRFC
jgi:hypothetical protein